MRNKLIEEHIEGLRSVHIEHLFFPLIMKMAEEEEEAKALNSIPEEKKKNKKKKKKKKRKCSSEANKKFETNKITLKRCETLKEEKMAEEEEEAKTLNSIPEKKKKKNKKRKRSSEANEKFQSRKFTLKHCETLTLTKKKKKFQTRKVSQLLLFHDEEEEALNSNKEINLSACHVCAYRAAHPTPLFPPNCKPVLAIQIPGKKGLQHPSKQQNLILSAFGFKGIFTAVILRSLVQVMSYLQTMEPYVTYGYPNLKSIKELIYKKGYADINEQKVPLTNNIIEQELGKFGIVCKEDMVNHIADMGPHFFEVATFLWAFELNEPSDGLRGSKTLYKDGGDAGNREDSINELINKMMN